MINGRAVGDLVTFDKGDFNFDGIVSWPDWHVLRTAHSGGAGAISSAAFARLAGVPEPTSAALAFCAAFAGCGLRRAWRNVPR